jgi:N-acetylglucosamine-6-phosphate deacetylase
MKIFTDGKKSSIKEGITYFLPTTVSAYAAEMNKVHEVVSNYIEKNPLTSVSGIHLEGPYINPVEKGLQNPSRIRPATTKELNRLSLKNALLITMAPEIEGFEESLPILEEKNGVVVSLGHTDAEFEDMNRANDLGINRMTHFPNGMNTLHHREIGCVGAGLLLDMILEMISDGIHSSSDFVKLIYKLKGPSRIILITDSIDATNLNDGKYDLGGLECFWHN